MAVNDLFRQALSDAGIPTSQAELEKAWAAEAAAAGSNLSNTSAYSPFWRILTALVTKPVLWLLDFTADTVLPNFFVKTAHGQWLDTLAWAVDVERKPATTAEGRLLFSRVEAVGELEIPAGTPVTSPAIAGQVFEVRTLEPTLLVDGQLQVSVPARATQPGSAFNLAPGYYAVLPTPVPGITAVVNPDGWLTRPGADEELDEQLRLRIRNQFTAVNQYHTDAVYRAMISAFPGVAIDGVYFDHSAPRGPGSANAYVLFEAGASADSYLQQINAHIREGGNHGHGDDLQVLPLPEKPVEVDLDLWPQAHLQQAQREALAQEVEQFIRTAFRENQAAAYRPTLTRPQARFSFSRLTEELHEQFAGIESLRFSQVDLLCGLEIPRLAALRVVVHA